jgi:hypothetical protein
MPPQVPYYLHPGYGYIDHQLDPLMDVIRSWAEPPYGGQEMAFDAIDAVRVAMTQLRRQIKNPNHFV